jgi:hypothetical protein
VSRRAPREQSEQRGYNFDASDTFIPGYKVYALQWSGPDLSPFTNLSWVQEQKQKP